MGYIKDCLLIINSVGDAASFGSILGRNIKEKLVAKRYSVIELSDSNATPSNVRYFLGATTGRISKMVIYIGGASEDELFGEKDGVCLPLMTKSNVGALTKNLDVIAFASETAAEGGIGDTAVNAGCHSWLGCTRPVLFDPDCKEETEEAILNYILSILKRKSPKNSYRAFLNEMENIAKESDIVKENNEALRLINFYD